MTRRRSPFFGACPSFRVKDRSGSSSGPRGERGPFRFQAVAGSNGGPSTSSISAAAQDCRSALASAYSGELHHARAASPLGNSRITNRSGSHDPSSVVVLAPLTRYVPPYAAMEGGASAL